MRAIASPYGQHNAACDSEPIHIPGAIQPQGALFVVEPSTLRITQASTNAGTLLGYDAGDVLGRTLSEVIGQAASEPLAKVMKSGSFEETNPRTSIASGFVMIRLPGVATGSRPCCCAQ